MIAPVLGWLRGKFNDLRSIFGFLKDALISGFALIGTKIKSTWDKIIKPVLDAFKKGIDAIKSGFDTASRGIGRAWDAIAESAKKPVRFVIDTVINKTLIDGFNTMAKTFGTKSLDHVKLGFYSGGPTGHGRDRDVAGPAHFNEHVVTAAEVRRTKGGHGTWEYLRALARSGKLARPEGWLGGGQVSYRGKNFTKRFAGTIQRAEALAGYGFNIFQGGFRPATSYSGTSHRKDALDFGPVTAKSVKSARKAGIAAWDRTGMGNWMPHIHGVPLPGYGTPGGSAVWQAANYLSGGNGLGGRDNGQGSGYHPIPGKAGDLIGGAAAAVGNMIETIIDWGKKWFDKFADPAKNLLGKAGDSAFAKLTIGAGKLVVDRMFTWVKKLPGAIEKKLTGDGGAVSATDPGSGGSNRDIGKRMMEKTWHGANWAALNHLWTKESGWNEHAKNPSSGAYGIPQSLPGSKMSSAGKDWANNPETQIAWGLNYIKGRYGSPSKAWAHSVAMNWYDQGGWLQPGLTLAYNGTGKAERVSTAAQDAASGQPMNVTVNVSVDDLAKMTKVADFVKMLDSARVNSRKTLRSGTVAA